MYSENYEPRVYNKTVLRNRKRFVRSMYASVFWVRAFVRRTSVGEGEKSKDLPDDVFDLLIESLVWRTLLSKIIEYDSLTLSGGHYFGRRIYVNREFRWSVNIPLHEKSRHLLRVILPEELRYTT